MEMALDVTVKCEVGVCAKTFHLHLILTLLRGKHVTSRHNEALDLTSTKSEKKSCKA